MRLLQVSTRTLIAACLCAGHLVAEPVGTAFTFQGQLTQDDLPVSGPRDFQFRLFDEAVTPPGNPVGTVLIFDGVGGNPPPIEVTKGLFSVELDFGPAAFDDQARWVEVAVRAPAGGGSYNTLTPRTAVTAAPYSLQTRGMVVDALGNVGIGTATPFAGLHVAHGDFMLTGGERNHFWMSAKDAEERGKMGYTTSVDVHSTTWLEFADEITVQEWTPGAGGFNVVAPFSVDGPARFSGPVGIGVSDPNGVLHISGEVTSLDDAHLTLGKATATPGEVSATLTFAGSTVEHCGLVYTPDTAEPSKLSLTFGMFGNPAFNPEVASFSANGTMEAARLVLSDAMGAGMAQEPSLVFSAGSGSVYTTLGHFYGSDDFSIHSNSGKVGLSTGEPRALLHVAGTDAPEIPHLMIGEDATGSTMTFSGQGTMHAGFLYKPESSDAGALSLHFGSSANPEDNVRRAEFSLQKATPKSTEENLLTLYSGQGGTTGIRLQVVGPVVIPGPANASAAMHLLSDGHDLAFQVDDTYVLELTGQNGPQAAIGTATLSPYYLRVGGAAAKPDSEHWAVVSDRRLKKNVNTLTGTLERLLRLRGVSFEFKDPEAAFAVPGRQIGFVAQEVETVFPEWVIDTADGYKAVSIRGDTPLIVEALRELRTEKDQQIEALRSDNRRLTARLERLERLVNQQRGGKVGL